MLPRLVKSVGYARTGIWHAFLTQPNMWIHLGIGMVVSCLAWWLRFTMIEWAILLLVIFMVIILEMINTVAEIVVDIASPDFSDLARTAKDVSAGAVLIAAIMSIAVGAILFGSKLV
jgi:diacylglycerol kinase